MDQLNIKAYKVVESITFLSKDIVPSTTSMPDLKGDGTEVIAELGEIKGFTITIPNQETGNPLGIFRDINGRMTGLCKEALDEFSNLVMELLETDGLRGKCDYEFVHSNSFEWILNVHSTARSTCDLLPFLIDKLSEEFGSYSFNFKMQGFSIESDLQFDHCAIKYFTAEQAKEISQVVAQKHGYADEEKKYKQYEGLQLIINASGTRSLAKNIAFEDAKLVVNVLQCFCANYTITPLCSVPSLSLSGNNGNTIDCWYYKDNDITDQEIIYNRLDKVKPMEFSNAVVDHAVKNGLNIFMAFVGRNQQDKLADKIKRCIRKFAELASMYNNHAKLAAVVSLLESIVLKDSNKTNNPGESFIKSYVIPVLFNEVNINEAKEAIRHAYSIRHSYTHNYLELPIDLRKLRFNQELVRRFILHLIMLHSNGFKSLEEVYNHFAKQDTMEIEYKINTPERLTEQDKQYFLEMLVKQGQVTPSLEKINSCSLLCIAYKNRRPVGIGAIKQVYDKPFDYANVPQLKNMYKKELGYIYVLDKPAYRGKGIAKRICDILLKEVGTENIFATTEENNENRMMSILLKSGFKKAGDTYEGKKTKKAIALFILSNDTNQ